MPDTEWYARYVSAPTCRLPLPAGKSNADPSGNRHPDIRRQDPYVVAKIGT
eukprot:CAMPEP_0198328772 /NCGR_PEP_ID=MMETSP1450-20131203/15687_1 /TAXON_ID=753684 ORGANISM="Madagascaria erythrocladiodes, Strain CCMP3234" /NCGR_SAMPLE_ID=MMETSP1450 /ASSEMBLY_ACC=CAM_ASM_001115 /LENGTH=50 /DNA_ID=CAMNT_0044032923 /DNA_START=1 /DNA_END=150 /DNA_ORIENTATION=+